MVNQPDPKDSDLMSLLVSRDGARLIVHIDGGASYEVFNVAWGYDMGDDHAHVTSNVSPAIDGLSIDFFLTANVSEVVDGETGERLYVRPV